MRFGPRLELSFPLKIRGVGLLGPHQITPRRQRLPLGGEAPTNRMSVATLRKFYQPLAVAAALTFVYFTVLVELDRDWGSDEN